MKKSKLTELTAAYKAQTKEALELLWANVNKGQKKQILKNEQIQALFERYGVEAEEE